jgi:hypothetical protein
MATNVKQVVDKVLGFEKTATQAANRPSAGVRASSAARAGVTRPHPLQAWANSVVASLQPLPSAPPPKDKSPQTLEEILELYPVTEGQVVMTYAQFDTLLKTPRHLTALRQAGRTAFRVIPEDPKIALKINITLCIKKDDIPAEWSGIAKTCHDIDTTNLFMTALNMGGKFILASRTGKLIGYGEADRSKPRHEMQGRRVTGSNSLDENFKDFVFRPASLIKALQAAKGSGIPLYCHQSNQRGTAINHQVGTLFLPEYAAQKNLALREFSEVVTPFIEEKFKGNYLKIIDGVHELRAIFDGAANGIALLKDPTSTTPFMVLLPQ